MDKEQKKVIRARIKQRRTEMGLTQSEVADHINTERVNVTNYELGRAVPPWDALIKLADLFDVSTDYLLGNTDEVAKSNNKAPNSNERELIHKIDLSDEELIKQFALVVDGRQLTEKEMRKILAQVRIDRQFES